MKISREEYKNILYICKKFNISRESVHLKTLASILDKRLLRLRVVLRFSVKHKKNHHYLCYNSIKRFDIRRKYLKEKACKSANSLKSWRRAVRKVRQSNFIAYEEEDIVEHCETNETVKEQSQQVRDKLKEQLQLLQLGKKNKQNDDVKIASVCKNDDTIQKSNINITNGNTDTQDSIHGECFDDDDEMDPLRVTPEIPNEVSDCEEHKKKIPVDLKTPIKDIVDEVSEVESTTTPNLSDTGYNSPSITPSKKGFLDSLLNKFKPTNFEKKLQKDKIEEDFQEDKLPQPILIPLTVETGQRTTRMRARKAVHQIKKEVEEVSVAKSRDSKENPFKVSEKQVPLLLPTPRAQNTKASAFVDQESAEEVKVKLEKIEEDELKNIDQKEHEGLVCSGMKPPHLDRPKKLVDLVRPRTVAEKRQLMQKKKGIKFLMMENESKIYNELAKINREDYDYQFNFPMLTALQKETVPYRRDAWRALSFLKTEKNRFFYKVVYVDGVKCNLLGSRGNFDGKKKFRAVCTPFPKYLEYRLRVPCCKPIKMPKNIKFNLDIPTEPAEPVAAKKLLDYDKIILNMKPGPLSEKLRKQTSRLSTDECLGPLELYTMPTVELEFHPKLGRPIDPKIQPYFKYLLPYENITEKWARFSVSLLKENDKDIVDAKFSFPIEYSNNQNKIMIRRRKEMQANISVEDKILADDIEKPLNFAKTIDPDDKLGLEISQILTEMTNCVAIGLSESCFIQNDPDIDYDKTDKPLEIITPPKSVKDKSLSRRVVRELRKLNATFITADNQNGKCSESFCDKGCICESLSTSLTYKNHCKNQECMLECTCTSNRYHLNDEEIKDCSFTSDEVQSLREKATARLARVEKEFTPTLVLSNNSTYLIPGSDREHARRSKRAPKRFSDFVDSSKISTGPFDETNDIVPLSEPAKSKFTPKDPLEAAVYNMKHCNVVLRQLQHVNSIEPWCMVHRLYKCFCNGQATEGRPFTFDDLEERLEERYDYGTRKPIYEFERLDRKENGRRSFDQSVTSVNSSTAKENAEKRLKRFSSSSSNNSKPDMEMPPTKLRRSSIAQPLVDLNSLDMEKFDTNVAQRCFPIDTKYQTRDPLETNLKKVAIKKYEEKHAYAEKLLQKRLTECERHFLEENRKNQPKATPAPNNSNATPIVQNPIERREFPKKKRKSVLNRPIRLNISNSEEEIEAIALLKPLVTKNMILVATGKNKILAKKDYFYAGKLDFTKVIEKTNNTIFIIEKTPEEQANNIDFLKCNRLVRRAKAVDINKVINIILQPDSADVKEIAASQESSQDDDSCSQSSVNIQDSDATYKDMGVQKIQHINMMISKAMQYICKLQKENSPKLIEPNISKLYFFTWKCMLQGFQQNLLSVWEIKCEGNRKAVIVTQNETKPAIEQLESLKNIKECTAEMPELSLFSKMLLLKIDDERTKNLSLTLYGGTNFWRITGFVNSENDYQRNGVVARPTPETHPVLSAKINYLFNLLHNTSQKDTTIKKSTEQNDADKNKTNIKICSTDNMPTIKSLFLPIPEIPDQRWLMLQVENDFSDIFIPDWGDYLSYDKISCALTLAKEHSKTVRVTMNDKFPEIYATPHRTNCIFFGPYRMNQDIDFILCQNVDGKWLLREDYEKKYNIKKENATFASWLYPKRDGEPSPRVNKPTAKVSTSENSSEPLPFKISHVQTAITDPNLIPILDSDEEQESVVVKNESMKRKSIDIIPSKTIEILPSKPEKRQKTDVPLKVTLLRKNGDAFEIKSKESEVKESSIQKKDSTIVRLSMPGVSSDKNAANVIGRRISLPLSALNSMKPVQQSQGGVSILKSTIQANKSTVDNQKPSTSKANLKVSNNPEVGKSLLQQVVIQTPTGMQIKSIVKKHKKSVSPVKKPAPPHPPENKIKNLQQSLPSSISIIPVNSTQNKQPVIAKPPVTKETVSVQPNKPPIATPSTPQPTTSQKSITNSNSIPQADVVHGYYISSIPEIGRILAEKRGNRLVLKMRNCDGYYVRRQFLAGQSTQYLNRYLRGLVLSFIPENYNLQWTFETSKQIIDKYPEHDPNKVPRKIIITEQGVVNLKQKWDDLTYLERLDKSQYLKILLIKLAEDCFPNQKFSNWDALQILQSAQKEIERLEAQTPQLAQTKIELQSKNSELLGKFDTLKSLYPDVKLEPDSSQASTEISSLFAQEISKETDSDDVEFVSFQKKGLEVICLDDDEDD